MSIFATLIRPILIEPNKDILRGELGAGARIVQAVALLSLLASSYSLVSNLYQICAGPLTGKLFGVVFGVNSLASLAISHDVFQIATNVHTLSENLPQRIMAAVSGSQFAKVMLQNTVLGPLGMRWLVRALALPA